MGGTAAKVDWSSVEDSLYSKVKADLAVMAEDMRKKLEAGQEVSVCVCVCVLL